MRNPISHYCKDELFGWHRIPVDNILDKKFSCCFFRDDGVQLTATVRDTGSVQLIHVSLAPIKSMRPKLQMDELVQEILSETYDILQYFFPDKKFVKAPNDTHAPYVKHYFTILP